MKTLFLVMLAATLAVGCDDKKASEGTAASASAVATAAPPASVSAAATATAAPSAAAVATPVPTPEQYEQKAAVIQPTAAEVELSKLEKEIGP